MKARKLFLICALGLIIAAAGATSALAHMRDTYGGVCNLDGVPGLLQSVHFLAAGTCAAPKNGKCSGTCTTLNASGKKVTGNCVKVGSECSCIAP